MSLLYYLLVNRRGGTRHFHKGDPFFFLEKKIKRYRGIFKAKITKDGKKKNDKDKIGNLLFKHIFTSL